MLQFLLNKKQLLLSFTTAKCVKFWQYFGEVLYFVWPPTMLTNWPSRLKALAVNLSRPSGRRWSYASLIGSNNPRWLKVPYGVREWASTQRTLLSMRNLLLLLLHIYWWNLARRNQPSPRQSLPHSCNVSSLLGEKLQMSPSDRSIPALLLRAAGN